MPKSFNGFQKSVDLMAQVKGIVGTVMRQFVAVDLPEAAKTRVLQLCSELPGVRWVKSEQLHLTLRFIGEVNATEAEALDNALKAVRFSPFKIALKGVGQFPPKVQPRVIWVGVAQSDALTALARQVEQAVTGAGFTRADKPFSAHITLTRLKTPLNREVLRAYFERHADFCTEPMSVDRFVLYSSTLNPSGAVYRQERVYPAQSAL